MSEPFADDTNDCEDYPASKQPRQSKLAEAHPQKLTLLIPFLRKNVIVSWAVIAGTCCCLAVIAYTQWLSRRILQCPDWAINCKTTSFVKLNSNNIALVQGFATITYSVGLAAMAYGAKCISESALWPILSKQELTLDQFETFLSAARGSIPATVVSWRLIKTKGTALVLLLSAITTVTPLVSAPLVGSVYARRDVLMPFQSTYPVANGIGKIFTQTNPPTAIGDNSQSSYVAWARAQAPEPMPDQRLWAIDRASLAPRGNMAIQAVRTETTIDCQGTNITEVGVEDGFASFSTQMATHNWRKMNSSDHARIRLGTAVAVWADDFTFDHANKTTANLVFAAFNGTLEGGIITELSNGWNVSSVLCKVGVEFIDDDLTIGNSTGDVPRPVLSSNAMTTVPPMGLNASGSRTLNENALWFAVAPIMVGVSVDGSQPLFYRWFPKNDTLLPSSYTDAPYVAVDDRIVSWSMKNIEDFIVVAIGSVAQASSRNYYVADTIIQSYASTKKLANNRAWVLGLPMVVILVGESLLLMWNTRMHISEHIETMRLATISEILQSALNAPMQQLKADYLKDRKLSNFGSVSLRFGWVQSLEELVTGLAPKVMPFRGESTEMTLLTRRPTA